MADNVTLDPGSGGDTIRAVEKNSVDTPVTLIDVGGSGGESLIGDGATMPISGTVAISGTVPVSIAATVTISGTVTANAGTNLNTSSLALESGGNLASINTKTPALGQALAAASVPVVLTADQISTLTPLATVAATQSGSWTVGISGTVPLPTGAATEVTLASIDTKTPALGQALAAASVPVVLTAAQVSTLTPLATVAVTQSGSWTVTANAGTDLNTSALALESGGNLAAIATSTAILDDWDESDRAKVNLIVGQAGIAAGTGTDGATVPRVTLATNVPLPAGTNNIGDVDVASTPKSGTATVTTVADTGTSAQLLAANASRLGATIENDSSAVLYVKLGTTASATDYTVRMVQYSYYEVPYGYTGRIDGIWASDPGDGAARITELT